MPQPSAGELLALRAHTHGDASFIVTQDETFTFAQAYARSVAMACALADLGLRPGRRVALVGRNSPDYVWILFGSALCGGVCVPINTALRGTQLDYLLADADPHLTVIDGSGAAEADGYFAQRERVIDLPHLGRQASRSSSANPSLPQSDDIDPESLWLLMYTSGTTGPPKGVMCPQSHPISVGYDVVSSFGVTDSDRIYCCLPLFHATAMWWDMLAALSAGATLILRERFSASRFWSDIAVTGATRFSAMMSMGEILLAQPPSSADRAHNARRSWIAPLPLAPDEWQCRFGLELCTDYAMTELHLLSALAPGERVDPRPGFAGRLLGNDEVRIVSAGGAQLPENRAGEIVVRPKRPGTHFLGYWNSVRFDTWFRTGDLGYLSEGMLFVTGRAVDSIRRRGENVASWEVEQILRNDPRVREAAVVGVPSELGEQDIACIVVTSDPSVRAEDLAVRAAANMAYFMVPRYWRVVEKMPVNQAFKVDKARVREMILGEPGALWDRQAVEVALKPSRDDLATPLEEI